MYCLCECDGDLGSGSGDGDLGGDSGCQGATEKYCASNHVFSSEKLMCVPGGSAECLRKYPIPIVVSDLISGSNFGNGATPTHRSCKNTLRKIWSLNASS